MIRIDLPADIEQRLQAELGDLDCAAKHALLLELYRQGKLTHFELSRALGLDRFQTEAMLKKHNVTEDMPTLEELEADRETLMRVLGQAD